METPAAAKIFEALSSGVRLDLVRLLVRHGPDGLVAGDIARELGVPASNLSFHLKGLVHAGLLGVEKEGRFLRYRANIPLILEIVRFLTAECCQSDPGRCQEFRVASGVPGSLFQDPGPDVDLP